MCVCTCNVGNMQRTKWLNFLYNIYIYICVYMVLVHAVLDYSIRGLLIPSISHRFYDWIDQMGSSSMVLEPRS
jgi:hypothetical protein